jgi:hypothetical protein
MPSQHSDEEPVVLIIGADIERCENLAYAFAQEGYEVLIPESVGEIRKAIIEVMPHLILLDYTPETHAAGMTVAAIAPYLGGDALGCAPPLLVVASSAMQARLPHLPGVYHIVSPASLDLLFAVVREHIEV